jgi:hypothetical protein
MVDRLNDWNAFTSKIFTAQAAEMSTAKHQRKGT